tara:strand:+ start:11 stop:1456 length:1446 start_codon:yes stop_codon:yes gene_type:complete
MSNYKTVFFIIGVLQIILGVFMVIPVMIQLSFMELDSSFILSSVITLVFGVLFVLSNLDYEKKMNLHQAFLVTSLSWITIAIFGSLPIFFSSLNLSFTDSFFESMSGLTTTGSTIISNLQEAPKSILLWRALLQWLGGIGIIVMAITLMPIMNIGGMLLFKVLNTETSNDILPSSKEISLKLILIYFLLTFLCGTFYKFSGMNIFDSVTHSMTTIATGGFSNYNNSIGHFNNISIEITAMIFIILGSLPFIAYIKLISGNKKIFFADTQIKTFFKLIIVSILIIYLYQIYKSDNFKISDIRYISFNIISILTGTGYVTKNFDQWGSFPLFFFLILMFIGGCAGSTTCGIKIFRVQILFKFIINQIKKNIYPRGIFVIKYENNNVNDKFLASIISFIYLYILLFFLITALLSLSGLDFTTSISGAATSISNVGPGLGSIIGSNGNFSTLPDISKWILCVGMILGRLELFAILVLFVPSFWKK